MTAITSALLFLIQFIFGIYIFILLLRLVMQKLRVNWFNPVSQFVVQLTEKPLKPLRKIAPGFKGFDLSIVLLALIVQFVEVILSWFLQSGLMPNIIGAVISAIAGIMNKFVYIYIYAIILNVIASWIPSMQDNPVSQIVFMLVDPLLSRIRRYIPLIAGVDISPIPALLILTVLNIVIVLPLMNIGVQLMMR